MLVTSVALFLVGAIFGLIALMSILKGTPRPKAAVYAHGAIQVIAFVLLLVYSASAEPKPITAIVLFAIAALGGLTLFFIDQRGKPVPKALAIIHPIVAVLGVLSLIMFIAQSGM